MNMIDFLFKCQNDFKFWCEHMMGLTDYGGIHDFQLEWFYLFNNYDRVLVEAPSGSSKTEILIAYFLWFAWHNENKKIIITSKSEPQAIGVLDRLKGYIVDNEILLDLKPNDSQETWNAKTLKLSNKCIIMCRPYSVNLKSYRADIIGCDEIDSYENLDIYFDHVVSRLNPRGKIFGITTPEAVDGLMSVIEARFRDIPVERGGYVIKKYPVVIKMKIPGDISTGISIWEERFPISDLLKKQTEMGEPAFQKNFMCSLLGEPEDAIFTLKNVMACYDHARGFGQSEGGQIFIACDFAISKGVRADFDAYVVLEKLDNFFIIKHIEIHKGVNVPVKVTRIQELYNLYHPVSIICDESNIGHDVIDEMIARGMSVIPQSFQSAARKELLVNLRNIIDNKKLVIPRKSDDYNAIELTNLLTEQLIKFREQKSKLSNHKLIVSKSLHDDVAISLAMAVKRATEVISTDVVARFSSDTNVSKNEEVITKDISQL